MYTLEQRNKIIELKNKTNLSFFKCRDALLETNWDLEEAYKLLREKNRPIGMMDEPPTITEECSR